MFKNLTKDELTIIRKSLPADGYEKISALLNNKSVTSIRMILTVPTRYKKEVVDAAFAVIDREKELIGAQKKKVETYNP